MLDIPGAQRREVIVVIVNLTQDRRLRRIGLLRQRRTSTAGKQQRGKQQASESNYWMGCVQFVPPVGSKLILLFSSAQKPRSPDFPMELGTAVTS